MESDGGGHQSAPLLKAQDKNGAEKAQLHNEGAHEMTGEQPIKDAVDVAATMLQQQREQEWRERALHQQRQTLEHLKAMMEQVEQCVDEGTRLLGNNQGFQAETEPTAGACQQQPPAKVDAGAVGGAGDPAGVAVNGDGDGAHVAVSASERVAAAAQRLRQQLPQSSEYDAIINNNNNTKGEDVAQRSKMTQCGSTQTVATESGASSVPPRCQLDIQKMPEDGSVGDGCNTFNSNTPTIITLTPVSLNPTAAKTPDDSHHHNKNTDTSNGGDAPHGHHWHFDYKGPKAWLCLVKHWPTLSQPIALAAVFIGLWIIAYVLMPEYTQPNSTIMRILFLFVGAQLAGVLVTFIRLPDMLGMLFFGVLYTNVGLADFSGYGKFEAFLREMALINIMLLAGLGLDANAFKKLWLMIMRLTLIPTIAEMAVIAVLARFTLSMPWFWGVLLGLVVTAVSPNVVVTVMLKLKEERLGLNNGIHTLIYAMTSCNDVVAIFLFGVVLSVIFSTDKSLTEQILQGPIGIGIGIVFGYVYGLMLTILPSPKTAYLNGLRFVLTVLGGCIAAMGSRAIGYPSAGALGCMTIAFFAGIGWKRQEVKQQQQPEQRLQYANENSSVLARLDLLWKFLKPVSFSLIGKEINFSVLDGKVVGYGALLVLLGSAFRLVFAYLSTYGGNLTRKERAYITISGFPKATVQAALGPLALDLARSSNADEMSLELAKNVLLISVLAIIFTAPLGAVLMLRLAPLWLKRSNSPDGDDHQDDGNLHNSNNNATAFPEIGYGNGSGDAVMKNTTTNLSQRSSKIPRVVNAATNTNSSADIVVVAADVRRSLPPSPASAKATAKATHHLV